MDATLYILFPMSREQSMSPQDKADFAAVFRPLYDAYCAEKNINQKGFAELAGVKKVVVSGTLNVGPNFAGYTKLSRIAAVVGRTVPDMVAEGRAKRKGLPWPDQKSPSGRVARLKNQSHPSLKAIWGDLCVIAHLAPEALPRIERYVHGEREDAESRWQTRQPGNQQSRGQ